MMHKMVEIEDQTQTIQRNSAQFQYKISIQYIVNALSIK